MNPIRSLVTLVANAASPKLVLAVAISSAVTGGVAGPLAYQAFHARDVAQAAAVAQQNQQKKQPKGTNELAGGTTTTSTSTTTTTTTTTTTPESTTTTSEPRTTTTEATVTPSTSTTTTTLPPSVPIMVSVSPDHAPAENLGGTQLSGQVYVFADIPTDASVTYSIDGSPPAPTLEPLDTTPLDPGTHTVEATVTEDDTSVTQSVSFTVVH
jgi:hypothetical protein